MADLLLVFILLLPIAVYIIVRIASSAYFRSKHDYLKKVMTNDDPPNRP